MKKIWSSIKTVIRKHILLITITVLFLVIRLPLLSQQFLLHDERDITYSGYSIARTGKDLNGISMPLSFNNINPDNPLFAIYYSALGWLLLPNASVLFARLPFVLLTTLLPFLVYLLIKDVTKNKNLGLLASAIFCFSPWVFHLTRLAMDISVAMVCLLGAILLHFRNKRWISYLLLFIVFYTYQGFRTLIPFLVIYIEIFHYMKKPNIPPLIKNSLMGIVFLVILFGSITFIDAQVTSRRFSQVVFLNNEKFAPDVDLQRMTSVAPNILKQAFTNKITYSINYVITNFIKGQDLLYLFHEGDYSPINGNAVAGQFFLPLIGIYYAGLVSFGKYFTKADAFILGLTIIGFIPALVSNVSATFSIRAMLTAVGFSYIIARGFEFSWTLLQKTSDMWRKILIGGFILTVFSSVAFFSYHYIYRRPVTISELYNEHERQLAKYLIANPNKKYTLYVSNPKENFLSYTFLNNSRLDTVHKIYPKGEPFKHNNLVFAKCPPKKDYLKIHQTIVSDHCLDKKVYDKMQDIKFPATRIPYRDISMRTAYFVIE